MPRAAWALILALLAASFIVSCASKTVDCPTCPPENSASLVIYLVPTSYSQTVDVDSVHVSFDGSPNFTVKRGSQRQLSGLSPGVHAMNVKMYRSDAFRIVSTSSIQFDVLLRRGERRAVYFDHDVPVVVFGPRARAGTVIAARPRLPLRVA